MPPARGRVRAATGGGGGAARLRPGGRVAGRASALPGPGRPGPGPPRPAVSGLGRVAGAPGVGLLARTRGFVYVRAGAPGPPADPRSRPALLCARFSGADQPLRGQAPG